MSRHVGTIYNTLGVSSSSAAVVIGLERGLIQMDEELREIPLKALDSVSKAEKVLLDALIGSVTGRPAENTQELATVLGLSRQTVKNHFTSIFKKIPAFDRAQLAAWYWMYATDRERIVRTQEA